MEKCVKYKWYNSTDNVRPKQGEDVMVATWYDCWNYDYGYYIEDTDEIRLMSFPKGECITMKFEDCDKWMTFDEPSIDKHFTEAEETPYTLTKIYYKLKYGTEEERKKVESLYKLKFSNGLSGSFSDHETRIFSDFGFVTDVDYVTKPSRVIITYNYTISPFFSFYTEEYNEKNDEVYNKQIPFGSVVDIDVITSVESIQFLYEGDIRNDIWVQKATDCTLNKERYIAEINLVLNEDTQYILDAAFPLQTIDYGEGYVLVIKYDGITDLLNFTIS